MTALVGHKEAMDALPNGAVHLLNGARCPIQMLRYGDRIYATQFHPEADGANFALRIRVYKDKGYFDPAARRADAACDGVQTDASGRCWPISCAISPRIAFAAKLTIPDCARAGLGLNARHAGIAQLVEQRFCKPKVGGSSPSAGTRPTLIAQKSGGRCPTRTAGMAGRSGPVYTGATRPVHEGQALTAEPETTATAMDPVLERDGGAWRLSGPLTVRTCPRCQPTCTAPKVRWTCRA